ncbi:Peptidase U49 [Thalassovita litoralis]|uniref:Peptidase U49 n=1 Tax=Thalassovita litoralis TaxID=1010611 RepID=A0A521FU89_9RHOB|nr:hypothetical protein [Thalassovita litoralis]SMO99737.1 Peptidase U49 [Thalassovita litoralis]
MSSIQRLDSAFNNAIFQFEKALSYPRKTIPRSVWTESTDFVAAVDPEGNGFVLSISSGLAEKSFQLWIKALTNCGFWADIAPSALLNADQMTQDSLVWLMLHEFNHIDLNHFKLAGSFEVVQRSHAASPQKLLNISRLCLEMQADHEATKMLLGAYTITEWRGLRQRVMAISGMMMLIELEDAKNNAEGRTHPKAATRIFQLLGHLAEMPLVQAQVEQDVSLRPQTGKKERQPLRAGQ